MKYRDDSVKHATSPSHRDCPRRGVTLCVFQIQPATPEVQITQSLRRFAQPVFNPSACFALCAAVGPFRISLVRSQRDANASLEKFRHKTTVPVSYTHLTL